MKYWANTVAQSMLLRAIRRKNKRSTGPQLVSPFGRFVQQK